MPKLNIKEAIGLIMQTMPFVMLRAGLYLAFGVFALLYFGLVVLLGRLFGEGAGGVVFLVATVGIVPIFKFFQHIALYFLQAGHIAVISRLLADGKLPEGTSQVEYGKNLVTSRFKEVSVLLAVNEIINAIVKSFNRAVVDVTSFGNFSALEGLGNVVKIVLHFSLTMIDEAILSFILVRKEENYWKGAQDGLILYGQSWKAILFNSAVMGLINAASFAVFFFVLIFPTAWIFPQHGAAMMVVAAVLAYLFKEAVVYPVAMAAVIVTFHKESTGKVPDPVWEARLDSASDQFRALKQKAVEFVR